MTTKAEKIAELKLKHPTISKGINDEIFELDAKEYQETIAKWADVELAQEAQALEIANQAAAKTALLDRLGITADEAKLLLS